MSTEALFTPQDIELQLEVRAFAASIPRELLLDMDAERISYPKDYLKQAGERKLLGLRFGREWGGRSLPWTSELVALEDRRLGGGDRAARRHFPV